MPIFEYTCDDCGSKFEKLVRRAAETHEVECPACGKHDLRQEYSTFAAHSTGAKGAAPAEGCGAGMCGNGMCGTGACSWN